MIWLLLTAAALLARRSSSSGPEEGSAAPEELPVRRQEHWQPIAQPAPQQSPCEAWSARAAELAVKPDGSPVTDHEMERLLSAPRWLIPGDIEEAVNAWARAVGRPPPGCDSVWAHRWAEWTEA